MPKIRSHIGEELEHTQSVKISDCGCILEYLPLSFDFNLNDLVADVENLSIGAHFIDLANFKQFLRAKAIKEKFGLKIKANEKKQLIATYSYRE